MAIYYVLHLPPPPHFISKTRTTSTETKKGWFSLSLADSTENNWGNTFQDTLFSQIFYIAFWIKLLYSGGIQHFNRTGVDATASPAETVPMHSYLCIWRSIFIKFVTLLTLFKSCQIWLEPAGQFQSYCVWWMTQTGWALASCFFTPWTEFFTCLTNCLSYWATSAHLLGNNQL